MLTADTITDEQIRELHEQSWAQYLIALRGLNLHYRYGGGMFSAEEVREARARCAEILNARQATP